MSIIDILKETYTTKSFLTIPDLHVNLEFCYSEAIDTMLVEQFKEGLKDLGIGITYIETTYVPPTRILVDMINSVPIFQIDDGRILRFPGDRAIDAMLWSAYSLAAQSNWLPDSKDSSVIFIAYNAGSQKVAASILYDVEHRLSNIPNTEDIVRKVTKDYCRRFIEAMPHFSSRIVTENGMKFMVASKGLLKKKERIEMEDFADELYGSRNEYAEELNSYCSYIKTTGAYQKAIENATNICAEELLELPIYRLADSVNSAKRVLQGKLDSKSKLDAAAKELRGSCNYKNVNINYIASSFSGVDDAYEKAAESLIYSTFLSDFTEILINKIQDNSRAALERLKVINAKIRNFCRIPSNDYGVRIKWGLDGDIDIEELRVEDTRWEPRLITAAQSNTIAPPGYFSKVWFAGEIVADSAKEAGGVQLESVYSLDSQLLCALYFKDNTIECAV